MSRWLRRALVLSLAVTAPAFAQNAPQPPVATKKPHQVKAPFGATREDEYYWLRDDTRKNPEMLAYLKAENAYADAVMAPTKPVQETLYKEIVGRIKQDDSTVPYLDNGYWYYTRYEAGGNYPIVARRKGEMTAPEEIILNQPEMAKGANFFQVGGRQVSPDNRLLAYAEDKVGRRQYVLKVKDLTTGQTLPDEIPNAQPGFAWAGDNKTILYIEKDPVTLLGKRVKAHVLGTPLSQDRLVYEEKDDTFSLGIGTTSSEKFVCIFSGKTVSDEQRCAPRDNPAAFTVIAPRERDFLYSADHVADAWVIRTNWQAPNYRLMTVPENVANGDRRMWKDIVPHSAEVFIEGFQPFDKHLAIEERSGGNKRLRVLSDTGKSTFVEADEPAYAMALSTNAETGTDWVRYTYNSLTTPSTVIEANMTTGERRTLKVTPVPGYDKSKYMTERVWAIARDGTKIPVSLVYAKGFKKDGRAALFQYAYGSYGYSTDPGFSPMLPSLLDRGMVYAIAHIRGGQEMGRKWYDDGRMFNKKNSFTDFIDVTEYLVKAGYAKQGRVAAMGGSAGGLLMGGVTNMAPQDYGAIISLVPFVDVVTTMLDPTIPLTTGEYDEWGNPENKASYDYMLSYSPYDQLTRKAYPAIFVGTGLWDSQVQYYEPAKYVARLRTLKTDRNPLLFRVNMEAGHGGKSGRFERFREQAEYLAFALHQLKVQ